MVGEPRQDSAETVVRGMNVFGGLDNIFFLISEKNITKTFHYLNYKTTLGDEARAYCFLKGKF